MRCNGPRAMPGADLWLPLRGEYTRSPRSARVSRRRRLARPTGLPRSSQTQIAEVFVLAKLPPNEGDLSVEHLGGVRRPSASYLWAGSGVATVTGFADEVGYGSCTHGPSPITGVPRPGRVWLGPGDARRTEHERRGLPRENHRANRRTTGGAQAHARRGLARQLVPGFCESDFHRAGVIATVVIEWQRGNPLRGS
jgi:hypothetical protein